MTRHLTDISKDNFERAAVAALYFYNLFAFIRLFLPKFFTEMKLLIASFCVALALASCKGNQSVDCVPPPHNIAIVINDPAGNNITPASGMLLSPLGSTSSGSAVETRTDSLGKRYAWLPVYSNWINNSTDYVLRFGNDDYDTIKITQIIADSECKTYEVSQFTYNGYAATVDSATLGSNAFYRLQRVVKY